jgi:hypothetical protein
MNELKLIEEGQELVSLTTGFDGFIDSLQKIEVDTSEVDLSKAKNRTAVIKKSADVTRAKSALNGTIDKLIESKTNEIQPTLDTIKLLKVNKKITGDELTVISKKVRKQVTDWEIEEKARTDAFNARLKEEREIKDREDDHELALPLNELFDIKKAQEAQRLEAERVEQLRLEQEAAAKAKADKEERERKIAEQAAAKAKEEAEAEKAQAIQDKIDAEAREKQAAKDRLAAVELAKVQRVQAENEAESARIKAAEDAKQAKIIADKNAKIAAENARLAELSRQQKLVDDEAKRVAKIEANKKHVGGIRKEIKEQIMKDAGIDEATAKKEG